MINHEGICVNAQLETERVRKARIDGCLGSPYAIFRGEFLEKFNGNVDSDSSKENCFILRLEEKNVINEKKRNLIQVTCSGGLSTGCAIEIIRLTGF